MESKRRVCSESRNVNLVTTKFCDRDHRRSRSRALIGGLFLSVSLFYAGNPVSAQTEKAEEEIKRPEYGIEYKVKRPLYQTGSAGRFNEDWSLLKGVDLRKTDDFWDRLKFIPLPPDQ